MARKNYKKTFGYDVNDEFDRIMALDVPFNQLNKSGRRKKRKMLISNMR